MSICISGYESIEEIYASNKTLVYSAEDITQHQPVVIKLMRNQYPKSYELERFYQQFKIAKLFDNIPGIIQIQDRKSVV